MAKSVNKVILIGNLTRDPEVKYTPQGTAVAKIGIATNERFKDKEGQWQDRPEYHNIVAWQRLAEIAGEYLKKGSKVYIEGRLQTSSWEKDGVKHYKTEVVAGDLVLLGGRGESSGGDEGGSGFKRREPAGGGFDQRPAAGSHEFDSAPAPAANHGEITDDDIPF
jgi:single-strand DNA-binding protein